MKKTPLRMCSACRQMKEKTELIRICKNPDGFVEIDSAGKSPGRGAYICKSSPCLKKARKCGCLSRSLKAPVPDSIYDSIELIING